jgi:hypothetical protein
MHIDTNPAPSQHQLSLSAIDYGVTARSTRRFNITNKGMDTLRMIDQCNTLELSCGNVISQKKRISNFFDYVTRSYKNELRKFKGNLDATNTGPSYAQRKELLKIRERTEFNGAMANYIMCTLVDKRRTAHACEDNIRRGIRELGETVDEKCIIPVEYRN